MNYVGVLYKNGKEFDTSFGKQPFQFQLGGGMVIPGWDQGLEGAKIGARRQLIIPPDLRLTVRRARRPRSAPTSRSSSS